MRQVLVTLSLLLAVSAAQAQQGPSGSRLLVRPMPSLAPSGVPTFSAEARLLVSRKGRVESVQINQGSGDAAFDKQWQKLLSDWRFVPAVDAAGEPVDSFTVITYTNLGLKDRAELPGGGEAPPRNAVTEAARLEKLTCKDFLWEYYIVTNVQSRRMALLDPLLRAPLLMYIAEGQVPTEQQGLLRERYDNTLSEVAKQCSENAEALVWSAVLKPALQASLSAP